MAKVYVRKTIDVWRIELNVRGEPGRRHKWIHLIDVETRAEADQWTDSFRRQTRYRVKRFARGGLPRGKGRGGRPRKATLLGK